MNRLLLWTIVAITLVIAMLIYGSRTQSPVNVTPDAKREINRAKQR